MRRIIPAALGGPLVLSLVVVTAWFLMGGSDEGVQAKGGSGLDPNVAGIDVITTGNTATSLGTIDSCVEVPASQDPSCAETVCNDVDDDGDTVIDDGLPACSTTEDPNPVCGFDIDVFLDDVPCVDTAPADTVCDGVYHNLGGLEYRLIYDNTKLQVNATSHDWLITVSGSVFDVGDCSALGSPCPDTDGQLYVSHTGTGDGIGEATAEPPGSLGVTDRHTLEVVGGEGTYVYLTLTDLYLGGFEPGVTEWTAEIDQVWDSNYTPQYGIIAIAPATCATVPSPTPTSTPTPTLTPTPTATPPATPTPPAPAVAWMYSCYLGASQPTEDALATISGDVLAAYRLRPDQGYDRWFPDRPTVSTMTALNPYDALFLLVTSGATWPQQPSGEPPADASLVFGWNSVCYTGQTKAAQSATQGIDGDFAIVYTLASDQIWQRFVPARPEVSTLAQLDSFTSVLILVTEESGALWVFDA
jgi:hypothetical protein